MADISKVQFFDIQESYGCGEPVSFRCRIVSDLIPSSKDWIGLYRVGWKLTADYVAYEWVSIPSGFDQKTEKEFVCTFKDKLPENDEDFFQFCYIDSSGGVCGVSSPFQFLEDYDIVVIEETKSMLVVDSKPRHLSGNYEKVSHELCAEKVFSNQAEMDELTREINKTREQILEKDKELAEMKSFVLNASKQLEKSEKTLLVLAEKGLAYEEKEKTMNGTVQDLQKQLCAKAQELELLKMEHSRTVDILDVKKDTIDELTGRCSRIYAELSQTKKLCENFSSLQAEWGAKETEYLNQIKFLEISLNSESLKRHESVEKKEVSTMVDEMTIVDRPGKEVGEANSKGRDVADGNTIVTSDSSDRLGEVSDLPHNISVRCESCGLSFPSKTCMKVIREHVESHYRICPVCNFQFPKFVSYNDFESHVYEHLAETLKCADGRVNCPMCDEKFSQELIEEHVQFHFLNETPYQNY